MAPKKQTKKLTMNDVGELLQQLAQLEVTINQLKNRLAAALVRRKDVYKAKMDPVASLRKLVFKQLQTWAKGAKEYFAEKRSIEFVHGVIGFRKSPYAVEVIESDAATMKLLDDAGLRKKYIRVVEELDREAILRDRQEFDAARQKALGLKITQTDDFFIDLKTLPPEQPKS
jgi:phage host-nuclease inhibitor protein Gam